MNRYLWMMLVPCLLATPAVAARQVYLKGGGVIAARSVWRSEGRVFVLVNRDSITDFSPAEIDVKRTFPHKQRSPIKQAVPSIVAQTSDPAPAGSAAEPQKQESRLKSLLSAVPKLSGKNPESLIPSNSAGGTVMKNKRDLAEKIGE